MRFPLFFGAATLLVFAMAFHSRPNQSQLAKPNAPISFNLEGAYRDGLYVGRLHRQQGLPSRPATGRWSRDADRQLFENGYRRGYTENQE